MEGVVRIGDAYTTRTGAQTGPQRSRRPHQARRAAVCGWTGLSGGRGAAAPSGRVPRTAAVLRGHGVSAGAQGREGVRECERPSKGRGRAFLRVPLFSGSPAMGRARDIWRAGAAPVFCAVLSVLRVAFCPPRSGTAPWHRCCGSAGWPVAWAGRGGVGWGRVNAERQSPGGTQSPGGYCRIRRLCGSRGRWGGKSGGNSAGSGGGGGSGVRCVLRV